MLWNMKLHQHNSAGAIIYPCMINYSANGIMDVITCPWVCFSGITQAYIGIQITQHGSSYTLAADNATAPDWALIHSLWEFTAGDPNDVSTTTFSTLRPRQDGRLFPDDIFKSIFFNENV